MSSVAAGFTSRGRRSASGRSWAIPVSPSQAERCPTTGWLRCCRAAPHKAKAGSSWLGSPPIRLRRKPTAADALRTFHPPARLKVMRGFVETCRLVPMMVTFAIGVGVLFALQALIAEFGYLWAALGSGVVLLVAGAVAGAIAVIAKWVVVGRIRAVEHPLWSAFVWRNEVSDTFVETVAAPWFARAASGTPVMNLWLRALGAKIGRGVWCETYWLPEADLVTLGKGATVNRGCVVQTHLFHDRSDADGHRCPRGGFDVGPPLRGAARGTAGCGRHRRPGVVGDARRRGSAVDAMAGQPDRAVEYVPQEARRRDDRTRRPRNPPRDSIQESGEESPGHRPVSAAQRQFRVSGVAIRTRSRIQGGDQPAHGLGDDHRGDAGGACARSRWTCPMPSL